MTELNFHFAMTEADSKRLELVLEGHEVTPGRLERLFQAIYRGADYVALCALRDATKTSMGATIVLPKHKLENLSRGKGWARQGKGKNVTWGERVSGGYEVGQGEWIVGGNDGFARKGETSWTVEHIQVGTETWTVMN